MTCDWCIIIGRSDTSRLCALPCLLVKLEGGIVSAAVDGIRAGEAVVAQFATSLPDIEG